MSEHRGQPEGVLHVTAVEARNLAAMDKGGTSDPYVIIKSTFNKQSFKTAVVKKTIAPQWNQQFTFYTSEPTGHLIVRLWDHDRWSSDDFLGEVAIPLKGLKNGKPVDEWYQLTNEPKKTKDKNPNRGVGEIRVKVHFPLIGGPIEENAEKKPATGELKDSKAAVSTVPATKQNIRQTDVKLTDKYNIGKELGRGGFSVVKEATDKATGIKYACKIIEKSAAEEELNLLQREIDIMSKLKHKNIIQLVEVFEDNEYLNLMLELVTGGELFDQIVQRGSYSERDAANIVKQILEAVMYMHSNGIAHRDLKPENLLCSGPNNEIIKVTDFGLSKDFGEAALQTSCGTPDYVAPEVLRGAAYDNSVDIWSIGVITYILLCGFPPFYGNTDQEIFEKILKAEYDFPSPDWDAVSDDAKQFIKQILVLENNKRPTAQECLQHPWMLSNAQSTSALSTFSSKMSAYNKKRGKK